MRVTSLTIYIQALKNDNQMQVEVFVLEEMWVSRTITNTLSNKFTLTCFT